MIIKTRYGGNLEVRDLYSGINTTPPTWAQLTGSSSGGRVTLPAAFGLPALGAAMRLVAGTIASLRLTVYRGRRGDKVEQPGDWRAQLLEAPTMDMSDFDWLWDVAWTLEGTENALLEKVKLPNGRVVELRPVPMDMARIYRDPQTGQKVIEVIENGQTRRLTSDRVLHIRGQTMGAGVAGVSRIWQHRDPVGAMLAAQRFEGRFFQNDARPGVAFIFPEGVRREQARDWKTEIELEYGGVDNSWKPFVAGGGVQITSIPVSLQDAQFVEGRRLSFEECGRIMDVSPLLLGTHGNRVADFQQAVDHFLSMQLTPRLRRIERALKADSDLFGGSDLYPAFEINDLTFLNPLTRAQVIHEKIQDGTLLPDEARAEEGLAPLPPLPDDWTQMPGQVPQITPVGGSPNPLANTTAVTDSTGD
jgi:HK97 family phage portal protein